MTDITQDRFETVYYIGGALKGLNDGRIGGYLVSFGSTEARDSYGEYFTPRTDYGLEKYRNQPVLYHHGQNDQMVCSIGIIDTLRLDNIGVYAEAQLDINHEDPTVRQYARTAYNQVTTGKLFWSSGSAGHLVRNTDDGEITQWWIVEGSLTPKPAEQTGRTQVSVLRAAMKHMLDETPQLLNENETALKEPLQARETSPRVSAKQVTKHRRNTMKTKMDSAQMLAALDNVAALDDATKLAVMRELAALEAGSDMSETPPTAADEPVDMPPPLPNQEPPIASRSNTGDPKAIAAEVLRQMKSEPATLPQPGGGAQEPYKAPLNSIVMRTKYHDLSPVDMSYMYEIRSGAARFGKMGAPDIKFVRELADKVKKTLAYESSAKSLDLTPHESNRILAIKDNELDNSLTAGQILEWIPTVWSAELWRRVRLENEVAKNFRTIDMPSDPYNLPIESTDPTVNLVPETTNEAQLTLASSANPIPDSVVGSGKVTLNAKKLALRVGFSSEAEEDSIIPFIPQLREQGIRAMANAVDNVILNGDIATGANVNINDIAGTPAATDKFLIFDGLLKNALVTGAATQAVNANNSAPTLAQIRLLRSKLYSQLNAYGLRPDDLVMFVDPYTWFKMLSIDEINAWLNNGRNATVNNGMLPNIDGIPVWPSQEMGLANADGKINLDDTGLNLYGRISMAAKTGWTVGYRRNIMTNVDYLSYYDSYQLTATLRIALINKDGFASSVLYGINVN